MPNLLLTVEIEGKAPYQFHAPSNVEINRIVFAISRVHGEIAIAMRNYLLASVQTIVAGTPYGEVKIDNSLSPFVIALYADQSWNKVLDELDPEYPDYDQNSIYLAFEQGINLIRTFETRYISP